MLVRTEHEKDFNEIYELVKTAFATAKVADGNEQEFVNLLRASQKYLPELAFVLEDKGRLIGHIMLTRTSVDDGANSRPALLLAPLAVLLEYRQQGLGARLVNHSLEKARQAGFKLVFLIGDIDYYSRFGFKSAIDFQISCNVEIPAEYVRNVMVCELEPGALNGVRGQVDFVV